MSCANINVFDSSKNLKQYLYHILLMYFLLVVVFSQINLDILAFIPGFISAFVIVAWAFSLLLSSERKQMRRITWLKSTFLLVLPFFALWIACDLRWHSCFRPLLRPLEYNDCRKRATEDLLGSVAVCEVAENAPDRRLAIIYDPFDESKKACESISDNWVNSVARDFAEFRQFQQLPSSLLFHHYLLEGVNPAVISRAGQARSITSCLIEPV